MPRKSIFSTTLVAQVRRYFGLEQQELASYLDVSRPYVADMEAGRRTLTGRVLLRLTPLARLLPATAPAPPAAPAPEMPPIARPAAAPLEARLATCRYQAGKLRRELERVEAELARARRWERILPELLAEAEPVAHQWLLERQQLTQATLHDAELAARYHLLRRRAEALEAEAAGLTALLSPEQAREVGD